MRVEISQVKKEAADFSLKVDRYEKLKSKMDGNEAVNPSLRTGLPFPQKKTEEEYTKKKKRNQVDDTDVLKSLFS